VAGAALVAALAMGVGWLGGEELGAGAESAGAGAPTGAAAVWGWRPDRLVAGATEGAGSPRQ